MHHLLILCNLCHELSFTDELLTDKGKTTHIGHSSTNLTKEAKLEDQSITGDDLLTEFHIIDLHEVG